MSTTQPSQPHTPPPPLNFTFAKSLSQWNTPQQAWLTAHQKPFNGIATANLIFHDDKILLVQRAAHDSSPNRWEVPGGAVDDEDPSILHGAARELWEESGLKAKHYERVVFEQPDLVPGQIFTNRAGTRVFCRVSFVVEVKGEGEGKGTEGVVVRLDPNEHQDWVWATEEEVRVQRIEGRELPITTEAMRYSILEGFRLRS